MDNIHVVKETTLTVERKACCPSPSITFVQYLHKPGVSWRSHQKTSLIVVNCKKCLKIRLD